MSPYLNILCSSSEKPYYAKIPINLRITSNTIPSKLTINVDYEH